MNRAQRRARRKSDPEPRRMIRYRTVSRRPVLRIELPGEVYDAALRLDDLTRSGHIAYEEHDAKLRELLRPYAPIDQLNVSETDLVRNPRLAVQVSVSHA